MNSQVITKISEFIKDGILLIAFESPIQERCRILQFISQYCASITTKCLLWNLGQETIKKVEYSNIGQIHFFDFEEYTPLPVKDPKDYFQILKFWDNYQGEGVLIIENLYPWISANVPQETQFFLVSEWIKSSLLNTAFQSHNHQIKCLILLGAKADLHPELTAQIPVVVQDLPNTMEIVKALESEAVGLLPTSLNQEELMTIARSGVGLYISDILTGLKSIFPKHKKLNAEEIAKHLLQCKINLLNKLYEIEFTSPAKVRVSASQTQGKRI
jgi:hypothetical protein